MLREWLFFAIATNFSGPVKHVIIVCFWGGETPGSFGFRIRLTELVEKYVGRCRLLEFLQL